MATPTIKAGTIITYKGKYVPGVTAQVKNLTADGKMVRLRNGLKIRVELCTIVGFECPHCGRKYNDEPWECTSDDCPRGLPISKLEAYRQGKYIMPTPPVDTKLWSDQDWVNFIDREGDWIAEVE